MTLIDTQHVQYGPDGRAWIPSSGTRMRVPEGASRPSGASGFRTRLLSPTERALMRTIGRPWV